MRRRILTFLFLTFLLAPAFLYAADTKNFVPLANYNDVPLFKAAYTSGSLPGYLNAIFRVLLSIGAILAILWLIWAGYKYSRGDNVETKKEAKKMLGNVFFGLFALLLMYLILYQINPCMLNLNLPGLRNDTNWQCRIDDRKIPS